MKIKSGRGRLKYLTSGRLRGGVLKQHLTEKQNGYLQSSRIWEVVAIRQLTVVGKCNCYQKRRHRKTLFFCYADDPNYKEQASEYQPPRHQPNDSIPLTAAAAMSAARSEVRDLMRGSTEENDGRPNKEVPEERTEAQIRPSSQGVRSKKRHLAIATAIIGQRSYVFYYPFIYIPFTPTSPYFVLIDNQEPVGLNKF